VSSEDDIITHADNAYESIRAINHLSGTPVPAPVAYAVLGNYYLASFSLAQALGELGHNLERSLDSHLIYEDDGRDPAESVAAARLSLEEGAHTATRLGELLQAAQNAIAGQGNHGRKSGR
jgi:hypothetical protein